MDSIYDDLENYNNTNVLQELTDENKELKIKLAEYAISMQKLQNDFDELAANYKKLELNYSSLMKTARAEIERKTKFIADINLQKDVMVLNTIQNGNVLNRKKNIAENTKYRIPKKSSNEIKNKTEVTQTKEIKELHISSKSISSKEERKEKSGTPIDKTTSSTIGNRANVPDKVLNKKEIPQDKIGNLKENIKHHKDECKPKALSIRSRRKSLPASRVLAKFSSDEDEDRRCNAAKKRITAETSSSRKNEWDNNESELNPFHNRRSSKYENTINRSSDKYESSYRHKRHFSPEKPRRRTPRDYSDDRHRKPTDYCGQRVLVSPPREKSRGMPRHHHQSYDKGNYDFERNRYQSYQDRYPAKHKFVSDYEEPPSKRIRTESNHKYNEDETRRLRQKPIDHIPTMAEAVQVLAHVSCQSPDYLLPEYIDNQPITEIKNTASTFLEDPRENSKNYVIKTENGLRNLSTLIGRNVELKPVDKSIWGITKVKVPEVLQKDPFQHTDNMITDIYSHIENPLSNISMESGEIIDQGSSVGITADIKLKYNEDLPTITETSKEGQANIHDTKLSKINKGENTKQSKKSMQSNEVTEKIQHKKNPLSRILMEPGEIIDQGSSVGNTADIKLKYNEDLPTITETSKEGQANKHDTKLSKINKGENSKQSKKYMQSNVVSEKIQHKKNPLSRISMESGEIIDQGSSVGNTADIKLKYNEDLPTITETSKEGQANIHDTKLSKINKGENAKQSKKSMQSNEVTEKIQHKRNPLSRILMESGEIIDQGSSVGNTADIKLKYNEDLPTITETSKEGQANKHDTKLSKINKGEHTKQFKKSMQNNVVTEKIQHKNIEEANKEFQKSSFEKDQISIQQINKIARTSSIDISIPQTITSREMVEGDLELSDETCDNMDFQREIPKTESFHHITSQSDKTDSKSDNYKIKKISSQKSEGENKTETSEIGKKCKTKKKSQKEKSVPESLKVQEVEHGSDINTRKNEPETTLSNDVKSKFSDLFGDSTSLITPEDLGLTNQQTILSSPKYLPLFEDAQDANYFPTIEHKTKTKNMSPDKNSNQSKVKEKSGKASEHKKKKLKLKNIDKSNPAAVPENDCPRTDELPIVTRTPDSEPDVVQTVIISTGVQPVAHSSDEHTVALLNTLSNCNQSIPIIENLVPVEDNQQNTMEVIQSTEALLLALATSTPAKEPENLHTQQFFEAFDNSNEVRVHVEPILNMAEQSSSSNVDSNNDTVVPDVRLIVKRRRNRSMKK